MMSAITLVAACSNGTQRYALGTTQFCVPNSLVVTAPFWVPSDPPRTPGSFGFRGCSEKHSSTFCPLPNVIAGSAHPYKTGETWKFSKFSNGAFYGQIAQANDSAFQVFDSGTTVVIQNVRMSPLWFIWHRDKNSPLSDSDRLSPNDELQAICKSGLANPAIDQSTVATTVCERQIQRVGLTVHYTFRPTKRVPANFSNEDEAVLATLASWECS